MGIAMQIIIFYSSGQNLYWWQGETWNGCIGFGLKLYMIWLYVPYTPAILTRRANNIDLQSFTHCPEIILKISNKMRHEYFLF